MLQLQIEQIDGKYVVWLDELGKGAVFGLGKTEDEAIEDFKKNIYDFLGQLPKISNKSNPIVSRQRRWQIKKQKLGLCIICGKKREKYAMHCNDHEAKKLERSRRKQMEKEINKLEV